MSINIIITRWVIRLRSFDCVKYRTGSHILV